jgi:hypothetical protein
MENRKTAAGLYSTAIMEASVALAAAGFSILNVTGLNTYTVRNHDLGTYVPNSVHLSFEVVKEPEEPDKRSARETALALRKEIADTFQGKELP